jgi:O-antigen/teichoic acid export membrane protein
MTVRPSGYTRDEPEAERLDRNYAEELQEVRVAQAGVQILFAFLLAIAFQSRFEALDTFERAIYLVTLLAAAVAAILLIAPVAVHRIMFRRGLKDELVEWTGRLAMGGLAFLLIAILGAVLLVVDLVSGPLAAAIAVSGLAVISVLLWYALPARWLSHPRPPDAPQ